MSNYSIGVRYERLCMRELERLGYLSLRQAGSHSPFDVIGFLTKEGTEQPLIRAIQVKAGGSPTKKARAELRKLFLPAVIQKEIWHYPKRKPVEIIVI